MRISQVVICFGVVVTLGVSAAVVSVPSGVSQTQIQSYIDSAQAGDTVLFASGADYYFSSALSFRDDITIDGNNSKWFSSLSGNDNLCFPIYELHDAAIKRIKFYSIELQLMGDSSHTKITDVVLNNLVFNNGKCSDGGNQISSIYLRIKYGDNVQVQSCRFYRTSSYHGRGIHLYKTRNATVTGCRFGSTSITSTNPQTYGYFANSIHVTGYDGSDATRNVQTVIENNYLYRCLTADNYFPAEDHGIYVCGFKDCRIENNYIYGWDTEPQGHGIKARNGEGLEILDNVIDRSGILLYIYDDIAYRDLKDVLVKGNDILIWDAYDGDYYHNGIHYWKRNSPDGNEISIRIEDNYLLNGAINFEENASGINVTTFNQNGGGVYNNTASHIELKVGINSSGNTIQ